MSVRLEWTAKILVTVSEILDRLWKTVYNIKKCYSILAYFDIEAGLRQCNAAPDLERQTGCGNVLKK